jgi:hypothetical protein
MQAVEYTLLLGNTVFFAASSEIPNIADQLRLNVWKIVKYSFPVNQEQSSNKLA